ncbi:uncharacterized protein BXZ73DRAFT_99786 [Epithele typhae]|uniref:uncharacterized protein n=1 Tax=Epithele typhae TaxID=378194 RepID=UPI0020076663|nr:uncharacterized protein BXZ73DRAFT_99786 [Epithele typhae]KAH9939111.1 hypothetical protein BXZ73DRAFT_99786 [Epithele typhae]
MSSGDGSSDAAEAAEVFAALNTIFVGNLCGLATAALLMFEYAITFGDEVNLFWPWRGRRLKGSSVLFLLNRYIVLITAMMDASGALFHFSPQSCEPMTLITNIFAYLQYVPWAAFAALRAYALTSKNVPFTLLILALSMVPLGVNLLAFRTSPPSLEKCVGLLDLSTSFSTVDRFPDAVTIISRGGLISADLLLVIATWLATVRRGALRAARESARLSFAEVLFRDGAIYFVVLLVLNALHVTLTMISETLPFQASSTIILFIHPITGILVSRFLIHLQEADRQAADMNSPEALTSTPQETVVFRQAATSTVSSPGFEVSRRWSDTESMYDVESLKGFEVKGAVLDIKREDRGVVVGRWEV